MIVCIISQKHNWAAITVYISPLVLTKHYLNLSPVSQNNSQEVAFFFLSVHSQCRRNRCTYMYTCTEDFTRIHWLSVCQQLKHWLRTLMIVTFYISYSRCGCARMEVESDTHTHTHRRYGCICLHTHVHSPPITIMVLTFRVWCRVGCVYLCWGWSFAVDWLPSVNTRSHTPPTHPATLTHTVQWLKRGNRGVSLFRRLSAPCTH